MEIVASLSQGRTATAQCDLFTHKSVPVIFEPPCTFAMHGHMNIKNKLMFAVLDPVKHMVQPARAVGISFAMLRPHHKRTDKHSLLTFLLSNFIFVTKKKKKLLNLLSVHVRNDCFFPEE